MKIKNNLQTGLAFVLGLVLNPFFGTAVGVTSYPGINAASVSDLTALSPQAQEILWEHDIIRAAAQTSPFSDNMVGKPGSGKPIIIKNDTSKVAGQSIVIPTVDRLGARVVQGNATRVGNEEKLKPGDFLLQIGLGWFGVGMDNVAVAQTVLGKDWENLSKDLLSDRLQKKQSDDNLWTLVVSATGTNTTYPNGKTLDTLSSSDVFGTGLIVQAGGMLKDLGALPMDARKSHQREGKGIIPPIPRYMQFLTDVGARPIKTETAYLEGVRLAQERGDNNSLFSGEYSVWDNNIIYPWINVRHGGYGSIGSILQPEALLGNAIVARTSSATLPGGATSSTSGSITGGGSSTAAAVDRDYFEFFSLFLYTPINGLQGTLNSGNTPRYFVIIDSVTGFVSYFSYTGVTAPGVVPTGLTGLTRLGSVNNTGSGGDYNTTLPNSSIIWGTAPFLTTPDGMGFQGVTDGAISSGSLIMECNAKGVPIFRGLGLGEMALVAGYGKLPNGKSMASRTNYIAPHGAAFANGIEVSYGAAAFQRPDTKTPNFVLYVGARSQYGLPVVS